MRIASICFSCIAPIVDTEFCIAFNSCERSSVKYSNSDSFSNSQLALLDQLEDARFARVAEKGEGGRVASARSGSPLR